MIFGKNTYSQVVEDEKHFFRSDGLQVQLTYRKRELFIEHFDEEYGANLLLKQETVKTTFFLYHMIHSEILEALVKLGLQEVYNIGLISPGVTQAPSEEIGSN